MPAGKTAPEQEEPKSIISEAQERIIDIADPGVKKTYATALRASLDISRAPKGCADASSIGDFFGIAVDEQIRYRISLTKYFVWNFLNSDANKNISLSTVKRRYSGTGYKGAFTRINPKNGNLELVFTYSEALFMTGHFAVPNLFPETLSQFVDQERLNDFLSGIRTSPAENIDPEQ